MSAPTLEFLDLKQLCGYVAAASWMILVWEAVITMEDEVQFVWAISWTAYIKWLYFFGKYFALALQTAVFGIQVGYLGNRVIALLWCRVYRLLEMVASSLLMLCFDTVLLLRIYALYGWRTWSSAFGTFAVLIEIVTTIVSASWTIPTTIYDSSCAMIKVEKTILIYVVGTFVAQAILLWLAYRRRESALRARSSIACVTIRDGLVVFSLQGFLVATFIWTLNGSPITTLMIFWIPVVTSVATTRIVLNLQRTRDMESQQFTSNVWGMYGSADSFLLSDGPFNRRGPY
ncbi:hypothetical protein V8E55_008020 [Tylopilus felleus]